MTTGSLLAGEGDATAADANLGFSVKENMWVRQKTADGRVYFFNRATGASQWHVPNELYKTRIPVVDRGPHDEDLIRFPAESRSNMNVDCVMEAPSQYKGPTEAELLAMKLQREAEEAAAAEANKKPEPIFITQPHLTVKICSARGLRDTDFMPGKDKSDPYCVCEIMGKPDSKVTTPVVQDDLNPVWDFTAVMEGYEDGDILKFAIWDSDDTGHPAAKPAHNPFGEGADFGDDLLGQTMVAHEELVDFKGPKEFLLDAAGEGIVAHLTVEFSLEYHEHEIEAEDAASCWAKN